MTAFLRIMIMNHGKPYLQLLMHGQHPENMRLFPDSLTTGISREVAFLVKSYYTLFSPQQRHAKTGKRQGYRKDSCVYMPGRPRMRNLEELRYALMFLQALKILEDLTEDPAGLCQYCDTRGQF